MEDGIRPDDTLCSLHQFIKSNPDEVAIIAEHSEMLCDRPQLHGFALASAGQLPKDTYLQKRCAGVVFTSLEKILTHISSTPFIPVRCALSDHHSLGVIPTQVFFWW